MERNEFADKIQRLDQVYYDNLFKPPPEFKKVLEITKYKNGTRRFHFSDGNILTVNDKAIVLTKSNQSFS